MCGITGIFNYGERCPIDRELATRMRNSIRHRGPDDEGHYFCDENGLYLGHRRLSIIDLEGGHQPMCNEDASVWIVFNGEIYNFQELTRELIDYGHVFKTRSDTEAIVHAYEQWGLEALPRLNGMYAFALWDAHKRALIVARDPFGVKPVYYWDRSSTLVFGSEIRTILYHPGVERRVDLEAVRDFLSITYVPSPRTTFSGIYKVPPGHALVTTVKGTKLHRYYKRPPFELSDQSEAELVDELQRRIAAAVKRQMIADVPVGAMLSGGLDSSTMVTLMKRNTAGPVKTFTVGFPEGFAANELERARVVSRHFGTDHHDLVVTSENYLGVLPQVIWHMEEPVATGSIVPYFHICQLARKHVKVVLTGQGVDEPFAGYPRHLGEYYGPGYRRIPPLVRTSLIAPLVERLPRNEQLKRGVRALGVIDSVERMLEVYKTLDDDILGRLFLDSRSVGQESSLMESVRLWQSDVSHLDGLSQMLYVDARLSLADNLLMYGDKIAMAVSLEARVPYLDLELMDLVERIPPRLKIRRKKGKYLFRRAVSRWIPEEILKWPKIGFHTPLDDWLQEELGVIVRERLLDPGSGCSRYFRPQVIREMFADHESRRQDYKRALLSLITFEMWHEQFIKPSTWGAVS